MNKWKETKEMKNKTLRSLNCCTIYMLFLSFWIFTYIHRLQKSLWNLTIHKNYTRPSVIFQKMHPLIPFSLNILENICTICRFFFQPKLFSETLKQTSVSPSLLLLSVNVMLFFLQWSPLGWISIQFCLYKCNPYPYCFHMQ